MECETPHNCLGANYEALPPLQPGESAVKAFAAKGVDVTISDGDGEESVHVPVVRNAAAAGQGDGQGGASEMPQQIVHSVIPVRVRANNSAARAQRASGVIASRDTASDLVALESNVTKKANDSADSGSKLKVSAHENITITKTKAKSAKVVGGPTSGGNVSDLVELKSNGTEQSAAKSLQQNAKTATNAKKPGKASAQSVAASAGK